MPSIAIPLSLRGQLLSGSRFEPSRLFAANEPGVWYDPSDLTTMFQDRAGTIPVTAPGQSVGKRLDKSGRGNHAVANSDAARGVYCIEPLGGRRNLLTYTEQFDNAAWVVFSAIVSTGAGFFTIQDASASSTTFIRQANTLSGFHTASMVVRKQSGPGQTSRLSLGDFAAIGINFNATTGAFSHNATSGSVVSISDTEWRVTVSGTLGGSFLSIVPAFRGAGEESIHSPNNTAIGNLDVVHIQLETGSTATPYQRVVSQYEVTEAGKPTLHYVQYDGVDDGYVTPTITPGTDKVQVFAGVRKLSDAGSAIVVELSTSNTNPGMFFMLAPFGASPSYQFRSRGTSEGSVGVNGFAAPVTSVVTGIGDIAGDITRLRVNGGNELTATANQGTGNYNSNNLYIGRRGGTTLPFNGRDYGLIVRFGSNLSAETIAATETWLNSKTGAY